MKVKKKKVSVIIPVYNAENYLEACLESVLGQTFQDFEVVLMNDGSCDGSRAIIDRYVLEYPRYLPELLSKIVGSRRQETVRWNIPRGGI